MKRRDAEGVGRDVARGSDERASPARTQGGVAWA